MSTQNYGSSCCRSRRKPGVPFEYASFSAFGKTAFGLIFLIFLWACSGNSTTAGGSAQEGETDIVLSLQSPGGQALEKAVLYRYARSWAGEQLVDSLTCHRACSLSYHSNYSYRLRDSLGHQRVFFHLDSGVRLVSVLEAPRNLKILDSLHLSRPLIFAGVGQADSVADGWVWTELPVGDLAVMWRQAWLLHMQVQSGSGELKMGPVRLLDSLGTDQSLGSASKAVNLVQDPSPGITTQVPVVNETVVKVPLNCTVKMEIWADSYHFGGPGSLSAPLQRIQGLLQAARPDCQWSVQDVADSLLYGTIPVQTLATQALALTAPVGVNLRAMVMTDDSIPKSLPTGGAGVPAIWIGMPLFANPTDPAYDSLWVNRILKYFPK